MNNQLNLYENSKNDPIPEITRFDKLGIILLGVPGIGKSTFIKNHILNKNPNIKIFSTDDVSLTFSKDPNKYKEGSSELNVKRLELFIKSGKSFIYDTTGTQKENITNITNLSKENNYTILFIHIMGTKDLSLKQNKKRERHVDIDYIELAYQNQFKNMKYFSNLNPNSYYIVYNLDGKYKFMKYDGKLYKRKTDKYVPLMKENRIIKFNEFFNFDDNDFDFEEEPPNKFKIGDKVKCKTTKYYRTRKEKNDGIYVYGSSSQTYNDIHTIIKIDKDEHGVDIMKLESMYPWYICDEWELKL